MSSELSFRGQRDGEQVNLLIRRHPWVLIRPGLIIAAGLAIIILMFIYFQASRPSVIAFFVIGLSALVYGLYAWFRWWNTMYLLTNERMIVITQRSIWSRRIEDYSLDKIQSVASDTDGPAGTLLNFGTVLLAIMGIKEPVSLPSVEDPYAVQEKILSAMKERESNQPLNHYQAPPTHSGKRRRLSVE